MNRKIALRYVVASLFLFSFFYIIKLPFAHAATMSSYSLSPGESALVTSSYTTTTNIYVKGPSFDYVKYYADGGVAYYGQSTTSNTFSIISGQQVIVTNTSSGTVTLESTTRVLNMSWSSTPALLKKWLAPGQSMTAVNVSEDAESIKVGGKNDYADYDEFGSLLSYDTDDIGGSMLISAGERSAITNRNTAGYEVIGPYESFSFADRETPAAFHWILQPGETMQAVSHATKSFYISFYPYFYEFALYTAEGELDSYGSSSYSLRTISPLERIVVTNPGNENLEITGPYDGFTVTSRSLPAMYSRTLQNGESLRIQNTSDKAYTLDFDGTYDFAEYYASGQVAGFGRAAFTSTNSIAAGGSITVTPSGSGTVQVVGPYDVLQFTGSFYPALYTRTVSPGESLEADNLTSGTAGIVLGGTFDYALYNNPGGIKSYYANRIVSESYIPAAQGIAFTNTGSSPEEIYAPYAAFSISTRSNPVTFKKTLAPGETIKADNTTLYSFTMTVSGQHHYVVYDNGSEVSEYGRPVEGDSYTIGDTEALVVTNSGLVNLTVSGPYDAFLVSGRANPALSKTYLPDGGSLKVSNLSPGAFSLDLEGTYDQASYMEDGYPRSFDRKRAIGSLILYNGERVTLTGAGGTVQVIAPYDVTQVQASPTPALALRTLAPGQSARFVNISSAARNIEMTGTHDMMEYSAEGTPGDYSKDRTLSYASLSAGTAAAVENSDAQVIDVYGAYECVSAADRSDPVTFKRTLSTGQSLDLSNSSAKTYYIYSDGLYDFAQYDGNGDETDAEREYAIQSKSVSGGNRLALTAAASIKVEGPFDVFAVTTRSNPALFEYDLSPRQSMEAVYTGPVKGDIHMTGEYDYSLRTGEGPVDTYARNLSVTSMETVVNGQRIAVENSDETSITVYGAYDVFQASSRINPVTFHRTLAPGESIEAVNNASKLFYLYTNGLHDYVQYGSAGDVEEMDRANIYGTKSAAAGTRTLITNADAVPILVEGAFEVYTLKDRTTPALFVSALQPGTWMETKYTGDGDADVKITGTYDFASYDSTGTLTQYGHHYSSVPTQNVAAGEHIAIQNSDEAGIEVYGPYDLFQTQTRDHPVTFVKTLGADKNVEIHAVTAKLLYLYFDGPFDYARYDGDGGVASFNTWYTATAQLLQGDDKLVVSPSEAQTLTLSGAYDGFSLTDRNERAVTVKTLQNGESYSVRNISPDSFSVHIDGLYDYQIYDLAGNMESFGNDSSLSLRPLSPTKRIVLTTADVNPVTVAVPTDAVRITDGSNPDEFVKGLESGESLEAVNQSGQAAALAVSGKYDLAIYTPGGNPYSFARETANAAISVPAGYRAVLTNAQTAGTVVSGSQTAFSVADVADPALNIVKPGQSNTVEIRNISAASWSLSANGSMNRVTYSASGTVLDYALKDSSSALPIQPSGKIVVTQPLLDGLALWGPYDAISVQSAEHPALDQRELKENGALTAHNLTNQDQTVKMEGSFTYSIDQGTEQPGQSPLTVPAGAVVLIRNTEPAGYQVYAPYGIFEWKEAGDGTGPISGSGAAGEIAKLDPADYDPQTFYSDPVDTATGAQVINRTLLTAHGAVPIPFQVQYHSLLTGEGALGSGWSHNFAIRLNADASGDTVKVNWNDFRGNTFIRNSNGVFSSSDEAARQDSLTKNPDGTYVLNRGDGTVYRFNASGRLASMNEKTGLQVVFSYSSDGRLAAVTEPLTGAKVTLAYNAEGRVSTVSDQAGRQVSFAYDTGGRLNEITDAAGRTTHYSYDSNNRIVSAASGDVQLFGNVFDSEGRVVQQQDAVAGGNPTKFAYAETSGQLVTTITDRNGHIQKRTHDAKYRLLSVEDELGRTTAYEYDNDGNRTGVTNALNQTATYTYDARGNLTGATDYTGNTIQMTYDSANKLLTATGPDGNTVVNTYDNSNRLLTVTDPASGTTTYKYDDNGLLLSAADPLNGITSYTYTGNRLTGVQNAEGETAVFGYDSAGRLVSQKDAEGHETVLAYNADDQLVTETDPLGNTSSYTYNDQGFLTTETDALGNTTSYVYDGNGNVTEVSNALNETIAFQYDGEGRLSSLSDPLGHSMTYTYDDAGNLLTETNAAGETVRYVYDALNRVTEAYDAANVRIYAAAYDAAGNLKTLTDALDHTRTNVYDGLNRLTQTIDPLQRTTSYAYNNLNRLISVTDPLQGQAGRSFDALSRITAVTDPNANTTGYTYDLVGRLTGETDASGGSRAYQYNALGLLAGETNGRGQATAYTYDAAGRLAAFTDPVGSVTYTYDANGNVKAVTDGSGKTLTRTFDKLDRVEQYTDEDGNAIRYTYDAAGSLTAITYPDGKTVTYTYDAAGRMKTVTDWNNRVTTYGYDVNGRLVSTERPDGTVETRTYDANGQLASLSDKRADGSVIYGAGYLYDAAGNVVTETVDGAPTVISSVYGSEYTVDINGPGLSPSAEPLTPGNAEMTYTADNRLATYNGSPVTYDADGNMTYGPLQGIPQAYEYDARNRLTEAGGVSYGYNSENNRTSVTANGVTTKYVIDPNAMLPRVLMETDGQGQAKARYVYGLGLIGREDASGDYQTYHYDRRGSTVALTDETGQTTDTYTYGNYGERLDHQGTLEQPFQYNGRDGVMTDANGLYYMRARYYNPDIKRFVNRDVVTGTISGAQTLNRYAYVNGNPISYVDPFGLSRDGDSIWLKGASFLADLTPGLGTVKGFQQAFTGRNYVTGERLSVADRWSEGIGSTLSLIPIPGLKYVGKYGTEEAVLAGKGIRKWLGLGGKGAGKYQVGAYKDIKGVEGLDAHHAGQKAVMKKLVDNYDPNTAPAINVPKVGHTIKGPNGIVSRSTKGIENARQLLARDIMELRRVYDDIPNSALKELIELNKKMYPEMRK
ncbi:RHS repeat-associated core domain-containing protein [Paenibacillus durus]|uniref:RHS repeat-associated core domain-containing protein n=2 Tax=Paenibacillus durus TaxID=44251 RepID=UPI00069BE057|nr:RHS repeat-associated core domain-containing protein [Paenibacillus durus]